MGESQYFQPTVQNKTAAAVILANFQISYGKFYDISEYLDLSASSFPLTDPSDDRYNETKSAQGTKIPSKGEAEFGHCGRESSPSGTEGTFDITLETGEIIATIYWVCPWSGSNKLEVKYVKDPYTVEFKGFGGAHDSALHEGKIIVRYEP